MNRFQSVLLLLILLTVGVNELKGKLPPSEELLQERLRKATTDSARIFANQQLAYHFVDLDVQRATEYRDAAREIGIEGVQQHEFWDALLSGTLALERRNMTEAIRQLEGAIEPFRGDQKNIPIYLAEGHAGEYFLLMQNYRGSYDLAESAYGKAGNDLFKAKMALVAGRAAMEIRGMLSEGRELLGKADVLFRQINNEDKYAAEVDLAMARYNRAYGNYANANSYLTQALDLVDPDGYNLFKAQIALEQYKINKAEGRFQSHPLLIQLVQSLKMESPELAEAHLLLGKHFIEVGNSQKIQEHLEEAGRLYGQMALKRGERASELLSIHLQKDSDVEMQTIQRVMEFGLENNDLDLLEMVFSEKAFWLEERHRMEADTLLAIEAELAREYESLIADRGDGEEDAELVLQQVENDALRTHYQKRLDEVRADRWFTTKGDFLLWLSAGILVILVATGILIQRFRRRRKLKV